MYVMMVISNYGNMLKLHSPINILNLSSVSSLVAAIFLDSDHQPQSLRTRSTIAMGAGAGRGEQGSGTCTTAMWLLTILNKRTGKQSIQEYTEFMYDVAVLSAAYLIR